MLMSHSGFRSREVTIFVLTTTMMTTQLITLPLVHVCGVNVHRFMYSGLTQVHLNYVPHYSVNNIIP